MQWRSKLVRQLKYPVRWMSFLAGGVPAILVFPGPVCLTSPGSRSCRGWCCSPGPRLLARRSRAGGGSAPAYLIAMLYWMAPQIGPGLLLIGAIFGCMWAPFAVAVNRLLQPPVSWPRALAALVVVPSAWLVPEWIRSYQGLGGPWGLYGASQWQHPAVLALAASGASGWSASRC